MSALATKRPSTALAAPHVDKDDEDKEDKQGKQESPQSAPPPLSDNDPQDNGGQQEAPQSVLRRTYGIQFSDTVDASRRRPCTFTRETFGCLLIKCHEVFEERASGSISANRVLKVMVFRELQSDKNVHFYASILCDRPFRATGIASVLQAKDHVYVSFSKDHTYFWPTVLYGGVPTVHKGVRELDPNPWHSEGRSLREEWADIPRGARAVDKARVKAYLGLPDASAAKAAKTKGMSLDDVAELIRTNGWREPRELYRFAEDSRVEAPALYEAVLRLGRAKLSELVSVVSEIAATWRSQRHIESPSFSTLPGRQLVLAMAAGSPRPRGCATFRGSIL